MLVERRPRSLPGDRLPLFVRVSALSSDIWKSKQRRLFRRGTSFWHLTCPAVGGYNLPQAQESVFAAGGPPGLPDGGGPFGRGTAFMIGAQPFPQYATSM